MRRRTIQRVAVATGVTVVAGMLLVPSPHVLADQSTFSHRDTGHVTTSTTSSSQSASRHATVYIQSAELDQLRAKAYEAERRGESPTAFAQRQQVATQPQPSARPDRGPAVPQFTVAEGAAVASKSARQHGQTRGVDSQAFAPAASTLVGKPAPIGTAPNAGKLADCMTEQANGDFGFVSDRWTSCQRNEMVFNFYEVSRNKPPEHVGKTTIEYKLLAQGDNKNRRTRVFATVVEGSADYEWGWWDNIWTAPSVGMSMITNCEEGIDVCTASPSAVTMPFATWDNNPEWHYWDVFNTESSGAGRDKISYNRWYLEFEGEGQGYKTTKPGRNVSRIMRCDSADYFKKGKARYPHACIFAETVTPLIYRTSDSKVAEVAEHIQTAQLNPNATYPLLAPAGEPAPRDKQIPGQFVWQPQLHRISQDHEQYQKNRDHKNGACYGTGPHRKLYEGKGLPKPPNTETQDCDEYPFASTLEGAASEDWDFSVKAVNYKQNRSAGTRAKNYYVDTRVLQWDGSLPEPQKANDGFWILIQG